MVWPVPRQNAAPWCLNILVIVALPNFHCRSPFWAFFLKQCAKSDHMTRQCAVKGNFSTEMGWTHLKPALMARDFHIRSTMSAKTSIWGICFSSDINRAEQEADYWTIGRFFLEIKKIIQNQHTHTNQNSQSRFNQGIWQPILHAWLRQRNHIPAQEGSVPYRRTSPTPPCLATVPPPGWCTLPNASLKADSESPTSPASFPVARPHHGGHICDYSEYTSLHRCFPAQRPGLFRKLFYPMISVVLGRFWFQDVFTYLLAKKIKGISSHQMKMPFWQFSKKTRQWVYFSLFGCWDSFVL